LLEQASLGQEPLGICPDTHKPVYLKQGRFGPYVQRGAPDDEEKKNASLLPNMKPADVTFEMALKLLTIPRTVGEHPQSHEPIVAYNGKFGPYIKCGTETRSLPRELTPLDITLAQAVELLAQPKARGRGRAAPREPLKTFESPSPITGQPVKVLEGRFGVYVSDGTTNATLPRGVAVDQLTFDEALNLLGERAARGPSTRGRRGRRGQAPKRSAAPQAAPKAKTPKNKAAPAAEKPARPAKRAKKAAKRSGRKPSAGA
jgi:DNA topoisomerase-1